MLLITSFSFVCAISVLHDQNLEKQYSAPYFEFFK